MTSAIEKILLFHRPFLPAGFVYLVDDNDNFIIGDSGSYQIAFYIEGTFNYQLDAKITK